MGFTRLAPGGGAATLLALVTGAPIPVPVIGMGSAAAAVISAMTYGVFSYAESRTRRTNGRSWFEYASRVERRTEQEAQKRHDLTRSQRRQLGEGALTEWDRLLAEGTTYEVANAARGLAEIRSNKLYSVLCSLLHSPVMTPVLLATLRVLKNTQRQARKTLAEEMSKTAIASSAYMTLAGPQTTESGLDSAETVGLSDAARKMLSEGARPLLDARRWQYDARVNAEMATFDSSYKLSTVLIAFAALLEQAASNALIVIGAGNLESITASAKIGYDQTIEEYAERVARLEKTLTREPANADLPTTTEDRAPDYMTVIGAVVPHGDQPSAPMSFLARRGELTVIVGENGVGKSKSTDLFRCLDAELLAGRVEFVGSTDRQRVEFGPAAHTNVDMAWRKKYVQLTGTETLPHMDEMCRVWNVTPAQIAKAMKDFDLHPEIADALVSGERSFATLSDGERTRAIVGPRLLLGPQKIFGLDEPLRFLDPRSQPKFVEKVQRVARERNIAVIMTSNSPIGLIHADQIITMRKGGLIISNGTPLEVYGPGFLPTWAWKHVESGMLDVQGVRETLPVKEFEDLKKRHLHNQTYRDLDPAELELSASDAAAIICHFGITNLPLEVTPDHLAAARSFRNPVNGELVIHNADELLRPLGFRLSSVAQKSIDARMQAFKDELERQRLNEGEMVSGGGSDYQYELDDPMRSTRLMAGVAQYDAKSNYQINLDALTIDTERAVRGDNPPGLQL